MAVWIETSKKLLWMADTVSHMVVTPDVERPDNIHTQGHR